jgi:hypothetical protein
MTLRVERECTDEQGMNTVHQTVQFPIEHVY